jgi:hypothetical protein
MVPRHDENGEPLIGQIFQWFEGHVDELRRHLAPVEDVSTVDDTVHTPLTCGLESALEVTKEVLPPSSSPDARSKGMIESQMSIGEEQDVD